MAAKTTERRREVMNRTACVVDDRRERVCGRVVVIGPVGWNDRGATR